MEEKNLENDAYIPLNEENLESLQKGEKLKLCLDQYRIYLSSYEAALKRHAATHKFFFVFNAGVISALTTLLSISSFQMSWQFFLTSTIFIGIINSYWILQSKLDSHEQAVKYEILVKFEMFLPMNFFQTEFDWLSEKDFYFLGNEKIYFLATFFVLVYGLIALNALI